MHFKFLAESDAESNLGDEALQRGEEQGKHDIEDITSMMTHEKLDLDHFEKSIKKC